MPRKKEVLLGVSFFEPDTSHQHQPPTVNFISTEGKLYDNFRELDKTKFFEDTVNDKELESVCKNYKKSPFQYIGNHMLAIDEISVSGRFKETDKYLYRLIDYTSNRTLFLGLNDVLGEVKKKIKNKYVRMWYNGQTDKVLFSEGDFSDIIQRMSEETHEVSIAQIKGNGEDDEILTITPYRVI